MSRRTSLGNLSRVSFRGPLPRNLWAMLNSPDSRAMRGEVDVKRAARGQRKRSELETRVEMRMGA